MQCFYFAPALKTKRLALNLLITFANVSKQTFRLMNEQMRKSFLSEMVMIAYIHEPNCQTSVGMFCKWVVFFCFSDF